MEKSHNQLGMPPLRGAIMIGGTGTGMTEVLKASDLGFITEVGYWLVIGTKREAKGLAVAQERFGLEACVVNKIDEALFHHELTGVLVDYGIDFIMMLGNHRYVYPIIIEGPDLVTWQQSHAETVALDADWVEIPNHNIHPAKPRWHGGTKMKGLNVHIHVLEWLLDELSRHGYDPHKRYTTTIVVHRAHAQRFTEKPEIVFGQKPYDVGEAISTQEVTIPWELVEGLWNDYLPVQKLLEDKTPSAQMHYEQMLEHYAAKLQQHVLRFEWRMLPSAVRCIAWEILAERCPHYPAILTGWVDQS